jgi:hypothetical protein
MQGSLGVDVVGVTPDPAFNRVVYCVWLVIPIRASLINENTKLWMA